MTSSNSDFAKIRKIVKTRAGISLDAGKDYLIENRLSPVIEKHGFSTMSRMVDELSRSGIDSELERSVIDALTTNETSFFRDAPFFDYLTSTTIPNIIESNKPKKTLSIWSAACSTGQEIYSVAILLKEKFPELSSWNVTLHATDISDRVLEKAKLGKYTEFEVKRGLSENLLARYFSKSEPSSWILSQRIRESVTFKKSNLFAPWSSLGKYDIILLRNVLIYFEIPEKRTILTKVKGHLLRGGNLFLGTSETTFNIDSDWVCSGNGVAAFCLSDN